MNSLGINRATDYEDNLINSFVSSIQVIIIKELIQIMYPVYKCYLFLLLLLNLQGAYLFAQNKSPEVRSRQMEDSIAYQAKLVIRLGKSSSDSAFYQAEILKNLLNQTDSLGLKSYALYAIGRAHELAAQYDSGRIYYEQALQLTEKGEHHAVKLTIMNAIGTINLRQANYDMALTYFKEVIAVSEVQQDSSNIMSGLSNLGNLYMLKESYSKAIEHFEKALQIAQIVGDLNKKGAIYNNISNVYTGQENYKAAAPYLQKAIQIREQLKDDLYNLGGYYINYAYVWRQLGKMDSAFYYAHKSRRTALRSTIGSVLLDAYEQLFGMHQEQNTTDSALFYLIKYIDLYQEQFSKEKTILIQQMETKYELAKKQNEIVALQKDKEIQNVKSRQQRILLIISFLTLLIFAGLLFLLFRLYQGRIKANRLLSSQKEEIEDQNKVIQQSLEEKDLLMREIHHRTKNSLYTLESLVKAQLRQLPDDASKEALKISQSRLHVISLMHDQLSRHPTKPTLELKSFLNQLCSHILMIRSIDLVEDIDEIVLDADIVVPLGLIVNELVINSLKHAFINYQEARLSISARKNTDKDLILEVKDNGDQFIDPASLKRSNSLGMNLINGLARQLQGQITFKYEQGLKARLIIPVSNTL